MTWQPISTAPRDGTRILAMWPYLSDTQSWFETYWHPGGEGDAPGWYSPGFGWFLDGYNPIGWLPLPAPPVTTTEGWTMTRGEAVAFLLEAAGYFERRPTNGEDRAHWSNVYNAENCRKIALMLADRPVTTTEAERIAVMEGK